MLPCFNEADNVAHTVAACDAWMAERRLNGQIIAVDDGSVDRTGALLETLATRVPRLRVVHHPENRGYGAAVTSGCDAAETEWIAFMDSDGQFHPQDLDALIARSGDAPVVVGRRRKRADSFPRKVNAKLYGLLIWVVLGVWVRDVNCGMKLFRRDVWRAAHPRIATGALFNGEFFFRLRRARIPWIQVSVPHYPRRAGVPTGAKPGVILRMFRELWALRMSVR